MNFGPHGLTSDVSESFAAIVGRFIAPALRPAGLGYWQFAVALIAGISAKEVVVSASSVLFRIQNISSAAGMQTFAAALGAMGFTAVNAYSMMIFCLLYVPCIASIVTIRRETGSAKWTLAAIGLQLGTAWIVSTLFSRSRRVLCEAFAVKPIDIALLCAVGAPFVVVVVRRILRIRRGKYCDCADCGGSCGRCVEKKKTGS